MDALIVLKGQGFYSYSFVAVKLFRERCILSTMDLAVIVCYMILIHPY